MMDAFEFINQFYTTERDIVSPGYDDILDFVCKTLTPFNVHKYKSGLQCWTWKVPDWWKCFRASIKDQRGNIIFEHSDHPMRIWRHSQSFNGWVDFSTLKKHLTYYREVPEAIPYISNPFPLKDFWGFSISFDEWKKLDVHEKYYVHIDTEFRAGEMKVGEYIIQGKSKQEIVFVSHLDGAGCADYGLSGAAIMFLIMEKLKNTKPYYTYRFLLTPHFIGSIAYMSQNYDRLGKIKAAIELDFMGNAQTLTGQKSHFDTWEIDDILEEIKKTNHAIEKIFKFGYSGFGHRNSNPEAQIISGTQFLHISDTYAFNSEDVCIPSIALFRYPYRQCLSSMDDIGVINEISLEESFDKVEEIVDILESNRCIKANHTGPLFLDWKKLPMTFLPDKFNLYSFCAQYDDSTILDVARDMKVDYQSMREIAELLNISGYIKLNWPEDLMENGEIKRRRRKNENLSRYCKELL